MDIDRLILLASAFRTAIERCDRARLGITFETFPRGSCGDAALLLGRFLIEHGAATTTYVLASRGEGDAWSSHAWLVVDDVVVDITPDQFDDAKAAVIVARDSAWHGTFEVEDTHIPGDFRIYDPHTVATLGGIYAVVLGQVDPTLRPRRPA